MEKMSHARGARLDPLTTPDLPGKGMKQTRNSPSTVNQSGMDYSMGRGMRYDPPTTPQLPSKTSKQTQNSPTNRA